VESGAIAEEFTLVSVGPGRFRMTNRRRSWRVCVDRDGSFRHVTVEGEGEARFEREAPGHRSRREVSPGSLSSPMPGTVVKVLVSIGDRVESGSDLLVVEAMKMEIKISTPVAGTVRAIHADEGDSCDAGQVLAEIEPA
jgi:pyruvate carboxylase subunit B